MVQFKFPSLSLPNAKDAMAMAVTSAIFSGLSVVAPLTN